MSDTQTIQIVNAVIPQAFYVLHPGFDVLQCNVHDEEDVNSLVWSARSRLGCATAQSDLP